MIYYNDYDLPECNSVLGKSIPDLPPSLPSMNCILAFSLHKEKAKVYSLSFLLGYALVRVSCLACGYSSTSKSPYQRPLFDGSWCLNTISLSLYKKKKNIGDILLFL